MPRSLARALAVASALAVATITLSGCTAAPAATTADDCAGIISKVLLTDDSATAVAKFSAGDVPKIFNVPGTPAPTCFYSSVDTLPPRAGVVYTQSHRTLLYIGVRDRKSTRLNSSHSS